MPGVAHVFEADWTWTGQSFEQGVQVHVSSEGKIEQITRDSIKRDNLIRLADRAVLPGFVNAHSHAFQRGLRGKGEDYPEDAKGKSSFWTWRNEMYSMVTTMTEEQFYHTSKQAFEEMRRNGITTVGEFHYFHHKNPITEKDSTGDYEFDRVILRAAEAAGIRIVLLNTFYNRGGFDAPLTSAQMRFRTPSVDDYISNLDRLSATIFSPKQSLGIVAHSVRAVSLEDIIRLRQHSVEKGLVFHMHLEEQEKEIEDCKNATGHTPMRLLLDNLQIDSSFTAVHCTHTVSSDMKEYIARGGNVCICPLTEANLGDGIADLCNCDGRICLGSDCNARICFAEEMRWLEYSQRLQHQRRGVCVENRNTSKLAKELLSYATVQGARSLGIHAGQTEVGQWADFVALDLKSPLMSGWSSDTILDTFIFGTSSEAVVSATCVGGKWYPRDEIFSSPTSEDKKTEKTISAQQVSLTSQDVVSLAVSLINVESTSGNEVAMADALEKFLQPRGWHVVRQPVDKRFNVYAHRKSRTNPPRLIFNSHIDTVPPYFSAKMDDKNIYGRGACDTKSLIASLLFAAEGLVAQGYDDIGLLFVVSEETDHSGMKAANQLKLNPSFLIVAEPTQSKLIKRQKGILKIKLVARGIAAHSGYPHIGESAVEKLLDVLQDLRKEKWPATSDLGETTLNIGTISGGQAANVVPSHAEALLMFRVIDSAESLFERVNQIISDRVQVERLTANDPVELNTLEGWEHDIAGFNTDIPYFKFDGKAFLYGPGSILDAHTPREYINIEDLKQSVGMYQKMAKQLLKRR